MSCCTGSLVHVFAVVVGFGVVLAGPVRAERVPAPGVLDARVREVPYEADQVVRLQGQVGYALELVFEPGEAFVGLASGDLTGMDFTAQGEHLFLKPTAVVVSTNLTVLTDRRTYRFDYAAHGSSTEGRPSDRTDVVYVVRFTYPPKPARDSAVPQVLVLNERYAFCGARQLKPQRAFDDGVRTTLIFGAQQELPAVFVRNPDGSESLVNFSVEADALVIHRVVEHLVLRRGSLTGCLRRAAPGPAHSSRSDGTPGAGTPAEGGSSDTNRPVAGAAHGSSPETNPPVAGGGER
jgi:type IV secretion system protein VirB9